jgi:hypothetical protein
MVSQSDKPKRRGPQPPPPIPDIDLRHAVALRLREAAGALRLSPEKTRRLANQGEISWLDVGGVEIIDPTSVLSFIERKRVAGRRPSLKKLPPPGRRRRGRPPKKAVEASADEEGASA